MNIATIIISGVALLVSLTSAVWSFLRERRESTIKAYTLFQNEIVPEINKIKAGFRENGIDLKSMNNAQISDLISANIQITICLARIEYFCVGVNTKIYSIRILNRMGGAFSAKFSKRFAPLFR